MERSVTAIIEQYILDEDRFPYSCLNGAANRAYVEGDPNLDYPLEPTWWHNGNFPHELKRAFFNYEDSDMVAGQLLQAYVARAKAAPTPRDRVGQPAGRCSLAEWRGRLRPPTGASGPRREESARR